MTFYTCELLWTIKKRITIPDPPANEESETTETTEVIPMSPKPEETKEPPRKSLKEMSATMTEQ